MKALKRRLLTALVSASLIVGVLSNCAQSPARVDLRLPEGSGGEGGTHIVPSRASSTPASAAATTGTGPTGGGGNGGDTGGGGAGSATTTTVASGMPDSGPPVQCLSQSCAGIEPCPGFPSCAVWTYSINDDCASTVVDASISLFNQPDCAIQLTLSDADAGSGDPIDFMCQGTSVSFSYDRASQVLYVKAADGNQQMIWTPACPPG